VVNELQKTNLQVDWLDFYKECLKNGWKSSGIIEKIRNAIGDVYGKENGEETVKRLLEIIQIKKR